MTIPQVKAREKTVTRRHVDSWKKLKAGDRLVLIEKGMGLAKGEHQVVLDEVTVFDVRVETLAELTDRECEAEGFPDMTPLQFAQFWARGHGHRVDPARPADVFLIECRRIEFGYDQF